MRTKLSLTLYVYVLLLASFQVQAQRKLSGDWYSPRGLAGVSYSFDTTGTFRHHSFSCLSQNTRSGLYNLSGDSIFVFFDTISAEIQAALHLSSNQAKRDTLYLLNEHTIVVNQFMRLYPKFLGNTFTLADQVFEPGQYLRTSRLVFEFDKFTLLPESYGFIDSLADFLLINENLFIEIGIHGQVNLKSSTNLTQRRAESVRDYLVSKSIAPERLKATGYGESRPVWSDYEIRHSKSKEEKERMRKQNSRAEFKILRT